MPELILQRPTMYLRWLGCSADDPAAGRRVRDFTALVVAGWGLGALVETVQLCASELLGNCVQHARPDARTEGACGASRAGVALRAWPAWLFLEVSDDDSRPPILPRAEGFGPDSEGDPEALLATSGRGLLIVRELADDVWWRPKDGGGKTVFARFALSGGGAR